MELFGVYLESTSNPLTYDQVAGELTRWGILQAHKAQAELIIRLVDASSSWIRVPRFGPRWVSGAAIIVARSMRVDICRSWSGMSPRTIEVYIMADDRDDPIPRLTWALFLWLGTRHPRKVQWEANRLVNPSEFPEASVTSSAAGHAENFARIVEHSQTLPPKKSMVPAVVSDSQIRPLTRPSGRLTLRQVGEAPKPAPSGSRPRRG